MALNPYDTCPCGSGKKFKFCCEKYFDKIDKAINLSRAGQHEVALRTMEQLTQEHGNYAPVWGYYAQLLYSEGQIEKADEAIGKGFEIDKNFAMGHLLRGIFREAEGEVIGALLLFRKAADAFDPGATAQLAQVYEFIARHEILLNRPVACRAALERALHFDPSDTELREQFQSLFGPESRLPEAARKKYSFRPTAKPLTVDGVTGRFTEVRALFENLTATVPDDPAAWFNLGLTRAWLGEQPTAVTALLKSIELEWDDAKAEESSALVEVLRCGQGMEDDSDYIQFRTFIQIRDADAVLGLLQTWDSQRKLVGIRIDEQNGTMAGLVVEPMPSLLETGTRMARVVANLVISGGLIRLWGADAEKVTGIAAEIRDRVMLGVGEPASGTGLAPFSDILQQALAYPIQTTSLEEAEAKLQDAARNYIEDVWAHRPLRSLSGVTPIDAAGSKNLRKRLLGIIKFLADCLAGAAPRKQAGSETIALSIYDFARLRHKLGAEVQPPGEAPTIRVPVESTPAATPTTETPPVAIRRDFSAMNVAELAVIPTHDLSAADLEDAMRAAIKLDARDLAVKLAAAGAEKPADPAKPDRYPFYACLITGAMSSGDIEAALRAAESGQQYDAEHNQGRRTNEFSLQKGKLHAKRGDVPAATAEFDSLIGRNPDEGKFYVAAIEAMLGARQAGPALRFAEAGLTKARTSNNRDLEGACLELSEAARRLAN